MVDGGFFAQCIITGTQTITCDCWMAKLNVLHVVGASKTIYSISNWSVSVRIAIAANQLEIAPKIKVGQ